MKIPKYKVDKLGNVYKLHYHDRFGLKEIYIQLLYRYIGKVRDLNGINLNELVQV